MDASPETENTSQEPLVVFTDAARDRLIQAMRTRSTETLNLRISIQGRSASGFDYGMGFELRDQQQADDTVIEAGELVAVLAPDTASRIRGAIVDYTEAEGFQIENPKSAPSDPRAQIIQDLIDSQINPAIAAHGGYVQLVDVENSTVYLELGGGCQGCGMVDVTLRQGIEVLIKETLPEIEEVIDTTDHAGGTNPYYQPSKK